MVLPDLLKENLDVVFCGTGAGSRSGMQTAYYAGCGNKFYCVLFNVGFTPVQLIPSNYPDLLNYDIGLTDLVKHKSGMDHSFNPEDYDVKAFKNKMLNWQPEYICFNGKEAAKVYFDREKVQYGLQSESLNKSRLFIASSTSPSAHKYWDERHWKNFKSLTNG